jgi:CDP-diacylglycerol--glycerol-3-phosphate 3-phosphatidyltransferase
MWFTWARIAMSPLIIICLLIHTHIFYSWIAAGLFIAASLTDWLDGSLARRYDAQTNMGKFMDPIADKILVSSVLIMLIQPGLVGPIMVLLLLIRDILVGGIRSVAAADGVVIDAKSTGKWKTALQMVGIPAILIHVSILGLPLYEIGLVLMWISVGLSLVSGLQYFLLYLRSAQSSI